MFPAIQENSNLFASDWYLSNHISKSLFSFIGPLALFTGRANQASQNIAHWASFSISSPSWKGFVYWWNIWAKVPLPSSDPSSDSSCSIKDYLPNKKMMSKVQSPNRYTHLNYTLSLRSLLSQNCLIG